MMTEEASRSRNSGGGSGGVQHSMEIMDNTDEIDVENMPSLASQAAGWKFWWHFLLMPMAFVVLNIIAFSSLVTLDRYDFEDRLSAGQGNISNSDLLLKMFQANSLATALILLVDAGLLYQATKYMEQEMMALNSSLGEEEGNGNGDNDLSHIHAKVSKRFDRFLGLSSSSTTSFLSLLYVATILAAAGSLASLGVRIYAGTRGAKDHCSRKAATAPPHKAQSPVPGLPDALQAWAQELVQNGITYEPADFVHLSDGRTFFSGHEEEKDLEPTDGIFMPMRFRQNGGGMRVLVSTGGSNSIQTYPNVALPREFISVGDGSFCCTYSKPIDAKESVQGRLMFGGGRSFHTPVRRIMCLKSDEELTATGSMLLFRNNSIMEESGRDIQHWNMEFQAVTSYDNNLWYALFWYHMKSDRLIGGYRSWEDSQERIMEYYKLDPVTMTRTSVANVTGEVPLHGGRRRIMDDFGGSSQGACMRWFAWITGILAGLVAFPAGYWMVKEKGMAAGGAPIIICICWIVNAFHDQLAYRLSFLVLTASAVCLLGLSPKWMIDRNLLLWGHYSILAFFIGVDMVSDNNSGPFSFLALFGLMIGVLLNHPVLQIAGWVGPILMITMMFLMEGPAMMVEELVFIVPTAIIVGCGMVSAGYTLKKYRAYIQYYVKRLWHAMHAAAREDRNATSGTGGRNNGEDLTRRLMD